tara:strand:- start:2749 stop:2904 length:156 start_codon:yes stop_codon:yes gene_type:complete
MNMEQDKCMLAGFKQQPVTMGTLYSLADHYDTELDALHDKINELELIIKNK